MNREIYEAPEMEIVMFEGADVITTSGVQGPLCEWDGRALYSQNGCIDTLLTAGDRNCAWGTMMGRPDGSCAAPLFESANTGCLVAPVMVPGR